MPIKEFCNCKIKTEKACSSFTWSGHPYDNSDRLNPEHVRQKHGLNRLCDRTEHSAEIKFNPRFGAWKWIAWHLKLFFNQYGLYVKINTILQKQKIGSIQNSEQNPRL